jgi:hypothetical protein
MKVLLKTSRLYYSFQNYITTQEVCGNLLETDTKENDSYVINGFVILRISVQNPIDYRHIFDITPII